MDYAIKVDEETGAMYVDLSPHRTKYVGVSVRQLAIDLPDPIAKTMIIDFDSMGRVLGIEFV